MRYICRGRLIGCNVMTFWSTFLLRASASISPPKLLWNIDCISYDHVHGIPAMVVERKFRTRHNVMSLSSFFKEKNILLTFNMTIR